MAMRAVSGKLIARSLLLALSCAHLLRLRLVVVGRIELSVVAAPSSRFDRAVHFAQPARGHAQRHDLTDAHHHVPRNDFDAGRREGLEEALRAQLIVDLRQRLRFVVAQEDGQQEGVVGGAEAGVAAVAATVAGAGAASAPWASGAIASMTNDTASATPGTPRRAAPRIGKRLPERLGTADAMSMKRLHDELNSPSITRLRAAILAPARAHHTAT
ncbi:hypothetical protein OKW42_003177 [Paraburkholderia sp. WC7.3d]